MKVSTKGRYALRLLADLAAHCDCGCIALKDIAARQSISKKYLEQIVPLLNNAGLLRTSRGFQGGYSLAVPADRITVGDVLRITEGSLAPIPCLESDPPGCERSAHCETLPVWQGLYDVVNNYLDGITVQDIVDRARTNGADDYVI